MLRLMLGCLVLAVTVGCGRSSSQDTGEPGGTEALIEAGMESWISAYERADVDSLVNLYEQDGVYAANTGEVLRGRDEIRAGVSAWIARRPAGVELGLETEPVRFVSNGKTAHTLWRFIIKARPSDCSVDAGHALVVWRRQGDGTWLITTQLVNRDPEAPADACSRRAAAPDSSG